MNIFYKRPLLCALTAFVATAFFSSLLFYNRLAHIILVLFLSLFVIIFLLFLLAKRRKRKAEGKETTALCCIFLAFLACLSQFLFVKISLNVPEKLLRDKVEIRATVKEIIYESDGYSILKARTSEIDGEPIKIRFRFKLYTEEEFKVGDVISLNGRIKSIFSFSRKEASFLYTEGCAGVVSGSGEITKIGEKSGPVIWISRLGDLIAERIESNIKGDSGALISALLLGRTQSLDNHITLDFKRLGISHMLALSGMHLTILVSFVGIVLSRTAIRKSAKNIIILLLTLFYITLSGFCLSVLRAAFMLSLAYFSFFTKRENDLYTSLFLAVTIIFLITPSAIRDLGLWLSFFGTLGIVTYVQIRGEEVKKKRSLIRSIASYLLLSLFASIFAIIFTLPITVFVFGELSIIAPLSNIIFGFLFDLLLILAFLSPFLCGIRIFSIICELLCEIIISLCRFISDFDMIFVSVSYLPFYIALSLFLFCLIFVLCVKMKRRATVTTLFSSFALLILTLFVCIFISFNDDAFIYERGDSSHGNELLFFVNDASTTVIDISSESSASFSRMIARCEKEHITEISNYIITRYNDSLHENLYEASAKIKMKRILLPAPINAFEVSVSESITKMLDELRIPYELYKRNEAVSLAGLEMTLIPTGPAASYGDYIIEILSNEKRFYYICSYAFSYDYLPIYDEVDFLILGHYDGTRIIYFKMPSKIDTLIADSRTLYNPETFGGFSVEHVFMDKSIKFKLK